MNVSELKISIIKWETMKILVSKVNTFFYEILKFKNDNSKSHFYLPLYHNVKMNKQYDWLSLYIMITKSQVSMNKSKQVQTNYDDQKVRFNEWLK